MFEKIKNYIKYVFPVFFLLFIISNYSFAATLQLQKIGALDLEGKIYPEWWYTGASPTFFGVGAESTKVDLKINDSVFSTTSDLSGNWSYVSQLENGDHSIEITQGTEKISFILHLGQTMPANVGAGTEESTSSVPTTGFNQYVAMSMGAGIILLATYFYFSADSKRKTVFENRMIKED